MVPGSNKFVNFFSPRSDKYSNEDFIILPPKIIELGCFEFYEI